MPGRKVHWTSRQRKRRVKPSQYTKIKFIFLIIAAVIFWPGLPAPRQEAVQPVGVYAPPEDSLLFRLLKRALAGSVPGMEQPDLAENEDYQKAVLNTFRALTGWDLRDPRTILSRELGAGALISLPVLHPPKGSRPVEDGNADQPVDAGGPQPAAPVFDPRFPFLGYSEPVALVYHNHITESFEPSSGKTFSLNMKETVAFLGEELVRQMQEQYGLPLIHHRGIYDQPRATAYEKARPAVKELLAESPQLNMVIDLHRDGVRREITTVALNGAETGKILLIIGTRHPGWESNLAFAMGVHRALETVAPGISRGVRRQNFSYNQDLHPQAILVEVGGHENTMEEALRAIPYLAEALARTYYYFFLRN